MIVRTATSETIREVQEWMTLRGIEPYPSHMFEWADGYVVDGLAACWMFPTRGPIALLENLVANPNSDKASRDTAIDLVVSEAMRDMKERGWRYIYSTTTLQAVVERARSHGFKILEPHTLLIADMGGP